MNEETIRSDFDRATRKAFWNQIKSWLTGQKNELLPYDEVRARLPIFGQHYRGLAEVPVDRITGSVGRYQDFDRAFLPRQRQTRDRWLSINRAHYDDVTLPPVELYKLGELYFVKDGNHRVSVARERNQAFIDAIVIEVETTVPLDPQADLDAVIREAERADFFAHTNLHRLRPTHRVRLSLPGQYEKLLEHINVHRWYLGVENNREIGWQEAVESWYDRIYLPLAEHIREQEILEDFPERTETDLYLWIIEHRSVLRGDPTTTPLEEAVGDFVEKRSERPMKKMARAVKGTVSALSEFAEEIMTADLVVGGLINDEVASELAAAEANDVSTDHEA